MRSPAMIHNVLTSVFKDNEASHKNVAIEASLTSDGFLLESLPPT